MVFLFIILLSSLFRLTFLSTIEFKTDEAVALFLASRPVFGHDFVPGATVSSFGILNPPLFIYILFPFTLISLDPKIISGLIGLLNVIAIGFFYLLVKKYYNKTTAFFASSLLAVSPWSIIFSRKIWTQDLIFPFSIPLLYSLHKIIIEKKTFYWLIYVIFSLFLLQLHQSMIFFLLPLNIFLLFKKPKYNFKFIIVGLILGILPLVPYLVFDGNNGFYNLFSLLKTTQKVSLQNHLEVFVRPFQIINQGNFHFIFGDDIALFAENYPIIFKARTLFYIEYLLLIFGIGVFFKRFQNFRFFIYLTFLLSIIYYLFRIPPEMHYFIILTPFLFIFVGISLSYFWLKKSYYKIFSFVLFFSLILVSMAYDFSFFRFLSDKKSLNGDYGTIFEINEERSKKLDKFKNLKEYKEMLITSYISPDVIRENKTFTKMIYSSDRTKNNLSLLDERLKNIPEDKRARNELLSFYTDKTLTKEEILLLLKKAKAIPAYEEIYTQVYGGYLDKNLRNAYDNSNYNFTFEYPRHWKINEENTTLTSDEYIFSIISSDFNCDWLKCIENFSEKKNTYETHSIKLLNQEVLEKICIDRKKNWCGSLYGPFLINNKSLVFKFSQNSIMEITPLDAKDIIDIILTSLRKK